MADKKGYYEQTDAQFKIRLPHELKEKIRASSNEYNRTMTADIVARLEQSFQTQPINTVNINIKDYLSEQAIKVFDEEFEQIRQKLRNKFKDVSQEDLDKFLGHLLER